MINFTSNGGNASVNVVLTVISRPTVSNISPMNGPATGGTSVTITGSGFTRATSVSFGPTTTGNFKVDSDTQITVVSTAGSGIVDVTVTTPNGTSATSSADLFTYNRLMVTAIDPMSGPATGGTSVTITGTGFTSAASVSFGSTLASNITFISDTRITAVSPSGCGIVHVTVTTPSGTSATGTADLFTYNPSTPTVAYIEPYSGPTTGGTSVIITGSGFMCASSVKFGSIATSDFKVDSDTQITVVSPPGDGTVDVTVITPSGTSATTYDDQFTYHPPICVYCRFLAYHPIVADISPTSGFYRIGTTVTIARSGIVNLMAYLLRVACCSLSLRSFP